GKSSGVVVIGATNRPDMIDPAIVRSGRLEAHIVIPKPDTTALVGILRHHLKGDLAAVVASAPPQPTHSADAGISGTAEAAVAGSAAEKRPELTSLRHPTKSSGGTAS